MKIHHFIHLVTATPLLAMLALAQGTLVPAGAPNPNFKTLQQVEPRIDLATVAGGGTSMHVISEPGSYYLSDNIDVTTTYGIVVNTSGVTLDLNGFSLFRSSTANSTGGAILLNASRLTNIWIKNGHITSGVTYDSGASGDQFTGPGFDYGVLELGSVDPTNVRVSHLHVSGCNIDGIKLGFTVSNTVEFCSVRVAGNLGILAGEIHHCTAIDCGSIAVRPLRNGSHCVGQSVGTNGDGINATGNVSHSFGSTTGTGTPADGIFSSSNVFNSYGQSAGDDGIDSFGNVSNSIGFTTGTGDGIAANRNVSNSFGQSSGDDGIDAGSTISYSWGISSGFGVGLECNIAIGCTSTGGELITNKYLMP